MAEEKERRYVIPDDAENTEKANETAEETKKDTTEDKLEEINNKLDILLAAVAGKGGE